MSGEELKAFKEDLKDDSELQEELKVFQSVDETLKKKEEFRFREKLESSYQDLQDTRSSKRNLIPIWHRQILVIVSAISAMILVVLILTFSNRAPGDEKLFSEYYMPMSIDLSTRSANSNEHNILLVDGIKHYTRQEYLLSRENLESYISLNPDATVLAFFILGINNIELQDYDLAENYFKEVLDSPFSYYHEHSKWYLGLTYLINGKHEDAEKIFTDFANTRSVYSEKSADILKKSNSLTNR
jgi:TolA-binding protein